MDEKLLEDRSNTNLVCRLCIKALILEYAIAIFENKDNSFNIHELIVKYLQLELSADDAISALICQDCLDHLEDFHGFYRNVEQKQKALENRRCFDFLEVKCENLEDGENSFLDIQDAQQEDFLSTNNDTPVDNEALNLISLIKDEEINYSSEDDTPLTKLFNIPNLELREHNLLNKEIAELNPKQVTQPKKKKVYNNLEERPKFQPSEQSRVLEDSEFSCEICKIVIGNFAELTDHFKKHHHQKKVYIKCCGKLYTARKTIGRHMHRHRNPDKFKCPFCDKQLFSTAYLKAHIESKHDPEKSKPLKCEICGKVFTLKKCYKKHMQYHPVVKEKQPAKCDHCSRSFSSESRLKQHRKLMHRSILPYPCEACLESFLTREEEESHRSVCKNRKLAQKAASSHDDKEDSTEEFICKICCKIFPSIYGLRAHISSIHENIHNFICDQCGKKFKLKASLQKHQLVHQGIVESPAQCDVCGKWLKSQSSLRVHQYIHDNSYNKCSICEHVSTTRRALKLHVKKVHRTEHNFHCQYCEKSFKNSTYLEEHMAIHTGAQLYACPHCLKESRSRSNMYAHVKRMHPEEWLKKQLTRSHNPNATQSHLIKL